MSSREELQEAHCAKYLGYGHLGRLRYDVEAKTWKSLRTVYSLSDDSQQDVAEEKESHSAFPFRHLRSNVVHEGYSAYGCQQESESYVPEISRKEGKCVQPGAALPDENHSSNCSQLLAFGSAVIDDISSHGSEVVQIPIAAMVSGRNGQLIRLVVLTDETTEDLEPDDGCTPLRIPSMSGRCDTYWTDNGSPVQQVCFATMTGYPSTWMAARLQTSTIIFNPTLHCQSRMRKSQSGHLLLPEHASPSLDAHPVLHIPISRTGGHSHADVSFHPHDHCRLALIDVRGNWSVWAMEKDHRNAVNPCLRLRLVFCGRLWTWDHERRLRTSLPYHDGWHRVSWCNEAVADSENLFICNRRTAAICNAASNLLGLADLRLGRVWENQYILDVQPSSNFAGDCFVLTSNRLFWFSFVRENPRDSGNKGSAQLVLAWQHFRQSTDKTLHLVLLELDSATIVLIASRLVGLVSVFRFGMSNDEKGCPVSLADPVIIALPGHPKLRISQDNPYCLVFRVLEQGTEDRSINPTTKSLFAKLFSLAVDHSIVEHLFVGIFPATEPQPGSFRARILPLSGPAWPQQGVSKVAKDRSLKGLIVPDGWVDGKWNLTARMSRRPTKTQQEYENRTWSRRHTRSNLDWRDVYAYLLDENKSSESGLQPMDKALIRVLERVGEPKSAGNDLLSEIASSGVEVTDVILDSDQFDSLLSTCERQLSPGKKIRRFPFVSSTSNQPSNLISIYDTIIRSQLASLSAELPDQVIVDRERLACRTAATLLLSTAAISPVLPELGDHFERAITDTGASSLRLDSLPLLDPPTSSPPVSPSEVSTEPAPAINDPVINRLRLFTDICPLRSGAHLTDPSLQSILCHLPTNAGADPSNYDYEATEHALAIGKKVDQETEAAQSDARTHKRVEKARVANAKKEQAKQKAAEEIALSQRLPPKILSSQVVMQDARDSGRNVQSSQAAPRAWDGTGSSSQVTAGFRSMSQPEQGTFGQRANKPRDKGKRRAAGF